MEIMVRISKIYLEQNEFGCSVLKLEWNKILISKVKKDKIIHEGKIQKCIRGFKCGMVYFNNLK